MDYPEKIFLFKRHRNNQLCLVIIDYFEKKLFSMILSE